MMHVMLPKPKRLHKQRDYMKMAVKGRPIFGPLFTLRIIPMKSSVAKIGFITSTKVMKLAVDRNRVKRRMREVARLLYEEFPAEMAYAFILKPEIKAATFDLLQSEVRRIIGKIPETMTKPPKMSSRGKKFTQKMSQIKSVP